MSTPTRRFPGARVKFAELMARFPGGSTIGRLLDDALRRLEQVTQGLPTKHQHTHLQTGDDAFPATTAPATLGPNIAVAIGIGPGYDLQGHKHALDLLLVGKGDLLTRNATIYARLPVPADGSVWVADSAQALGWVATPLTAALDEARYLALRASWWR